MGIADHLRFLVGYNRWANEKIETAAQGLTPEDLDFSLSSTYPNLGRTIIHMTGAQAGWLGRLTDNPIDRDVLLEKIVADRWGELRASQDGWEEFVAAMTDEQAEATVTFGLGDAQRSGVLGRLITHVVNHGSHHRAELAMMLTDIDRSPGELDIVFYEP